MGIFFFTDHTAHFHHKNLSFKKKKKQVNRLTSLNICIFNYLTSLFSYSVTKNQSIGVKSQMRKATDKYCVAVNLLLQGLIMPAISPQLLLPCFCLIASWPCCHGNKITSCVWGHGNSANQRCCWGKKEAGPFFKILDLYNVYLQVSPEAAVLTVRYENTEISSIK